MTVTVVGCVVATSAQAVAAAASLAAPCQFATNDWAFFVHAVCSQASIIERASRLDSLCETIHAADAANGQESRAFIRIYRLGG